MPACDINAEAAVLSAIILSPTALDEVRDALEPRDFLAPAHRDLFEAVLALDAAGTRIDHVTIQHALIARKRFHAVGGSAFLAQIIDATPAVANVLDHARLVRQLALLRRMGGVLRELAFEAGRSETRGSVEPFLQRCEAEVFAANIGAAETESAFTLHEAMAAAAIEMDPSRPREPRGVPSGLPELDELSLGLAPGELWYIAGRPGMGKTALALGIARHVAATGRLAVFFSLEMKTPELSERMVSMESGVPYRALQKRLLTAEQWAEASGALMRLSRLSMVIDHTSELAPSRLRSRVRRAVSRLSRSGATARLGVIVVDYVQLMAADAAGGRSDSRSRNDELERISRALKLLAGEFGCTVLALSQLSRPKPGAGSHAPGLSELRGSGALEQDADKVLFVHRTEIDGEEPRGDAELILAKGRNAGRGSVNVLWQPWCVRFMPCESARIEFGDSTEYDQ